MGIYGKFNPNIVDIPAIAAEMRATEAASWLNGFVRILYPNIAGGTFNAWENRDTGGEPVVLWEGEARIQPLRSSQIISGAFEQLAIRGIRFKIPLGAQIASGTVLREGLQVQVVDGGEDEALTQFTYVISGALNSSLAWNRTIEATVDTGAPI